MTYSARRSWDAEISDAVVRRTFRSCTWRRCVGPWRRAPRRRWANPACPPSPRCRPPEPWPSTSARLASSMATTRRATSPSWPVLGRISGYATIRYEGNVLLTSSRITSLICRSEPQRKTSLNFRRGTARRAVSWPMCCKQRWTLNVIKLRRSK